MDKNLQAIGIGSPVADLLINIDRLPHRDRGAVLLDMSYQFGGKVPTAMAALGRLGVPCGMIGVVGGDDRGQACLKDFERHNVDTSRMVVDTGIETRMSVVLSDRSGERNIMKTAVPAKDVTVAQLDKEYITKARVLHLSTAGEPQRVAAQWMREAGGQVCFDADGFKPEYEEMAPYIDAFITSESYYTDHYTGVDLKTACANIASQGPSIVVVTLGKKGCACYSKGQFTEVPVWKVPVVDATGAGDTFHGAFIYGLLKGWETPECAKFASAVSAVKCTAIGGRSGLPTLQMVEEFMKTGKIDRKEIEERIAFYRKPHGMQA